LDPTGTKGVTGRCKRYEKKKEPRMNAPPQEFMMPNAIKAWPEWGRSELRDYKKGGKKWKRSKQALALARVGENGEKGGLRQVNEKKGGKKGGQKACVLE